MDGSSRLIRRKCACRFSNVRIILTCPSCKRSVRLRPGSKLKGLQKLLWPTQQKRISCQQTIFKTLITCWKLSCGKKASFCNNLKITNLSYRHHPKTHSTKHQIEGTYSSLNYKTDIFLFSSQHRAQHSRCMFKNHC